MPKWIEEIPTEMDYIGQRNAERIFQVIILLFAVVGFLWGYYCEQLSQTMYITLSGVALASIITLPPWPWFRRNPLKWQPARVIPSEFDPNSESSGAATAYPTDSSAGASGDHKPSGKGKKKAKKSD